MELECDLTAEQRACYDAAVQEWQHLRIGVHAAAVMTGSGRDVWKVFWATQQRFFKLLCVSMKARVLNALCIPLAVPRRIGSLRLQPSVNAPVRIISVRRAPSQLATAIPRLLRSRAFKSPHTKLCCVGVL